MNLELQQDIYNLLKSVVSGSTNHVYNQFLPSEELLEELTVVYQLNNISNEDTLDSKEAEKTYRLRIKINAPTENLVYNNSIYIKQNIYRLRTINTRVKYLHLETEDFFLDEEIYRTDGKKVYTNYLSYELKYS